MYVIVSVGVSAIAACSVAKALTERRHLLPVPCRAIPVRIGVPLANESAIFRIIVPTLTLEMIDSAVRIEPNYGVARAGLLRVGLGIIESLTKCRICK